ncbi:MAG: hypothetical protein ACOYOV_05160 [Bacteroidales bacterium]
MLNRKLFIDEKEMELGEISFPLNFQCSDVADMNNITCNYSFTIKLPKSTSNLLIIGQSQEITNESIFPYQYHNARYYVDGVPIFEEGNARTLKITDTIEITVMFGNYELLGIIEKLKLREVALTDVLMWNYSLAPTTNAGFGIAQYGMTVNYAKLYPSRVMPFVKAKKLFDSIIPTYAMPTGISNHLSELVLPLTSKNSELQYLNDVYCHVALSNDFTIFQSQQAQTNVWLTFFNSYEDYSDLYNLTYKSSNGQRYFIVPATGWYKFTFKIFLNVNDRIADIYGVVQILDGISGDVIDSIGITLNNSNFINETIYSVKLNEGQIISLRFSATDPISHPTNPVFNWITIMLAGSYFKFELDTSNSDNDFDKIGTGFRLKYPIKNNLPDVSQKDFIKSIMQLYGLMAQIIDSVPVFFTFNEVYNNFVNAFDWTDSLVLETRHESNIDFSSDIAEKNLIKYKEDTKVKTGYGDSNIDSANQVLKERIILTNQIYSATESTSEKDLTNASFDMCTFGLFEIQSNGSYKTVNIKQRICKLETKSMNFAVQSIFGEPTGISSGSVNRSVLRFEDAGNGLTYDELISTYWAKYAEVMYKFKQSKLKFILSPIQISQFRFDIPIYLKQYSRYFFVKRINSWEANKIVEIDLIVL